MPQQHNKPSDKVFWLALLVIVLIAILISGWLLNTMKTEPLETPGVKYQHVPLQGARSTNHRLNAQELQPAASSALFDVTSPSVQVSRQ